MFREKQRASRTIRTLEKRVRDATTAADDAQKSVHHYKEQVGENSLIFCFFGRIFIE